MLQRQHGDQFKSKVLFCSSTGISGTVIKAPTIHSLLGLGLGSEDADQRVDTISDSVRERWMNCSTIVWDEVAFSAHSLMQLVYDMGELLRPGCWHGPEKSIQLIILGDFLQTSPVADFELKEGVQQDEAQQQDYHRPDAKFVFEAECWPLLLFECILLPGSRRHGDVRFRMLLDKLSVGRIDDEVRNCIKVLMQQQMPADIKQCVSLFPTKKQAFQHNNKCLRECLESARVVCGSKKHSYQCVTVGERNKKKWKRMYDGMMVVDLLELCTDANVLLIRNMDEDLKNGTVASCEDFVHCDTVEIVEALMEDLQCSEEVALQYARQVNPGMVWPRIRTADGVVVVLGPRLFSMCDNQGVVIVSQIQVPLLLSWAMTIHKSQSLTLPRVAVRLSRGMRHGQFYTALSRARSMEGVYIVGMSVNWMTCVVVHPLVLKWLKEQPWKRLVKVPDQ